MRLSLAICIACLAVTPAGANGSAAIDHPSAPVNVGGNFAFIYDSVGEFIGSPISFDGMIAQLPLRINGTRVLASLERDGFLAENTLFFKSSDCSGQAYIAANPATFFAPSAVSSPGRTLYVRPASATPAKFDSASAIVGSGCIFEESGGPFWPVVPTIDLNDRFPPPFKIKLSVPPVDVSP